VRASLAACLHGIGKLSPSPKELVLLTAVAAFLAACGPAPTPPPAEGAQPAAASELALAQAALGGSDAAQIPAASRPTPPAQTPAVDVIGLRLGMTPDEALRQKYGEPTVASAEGWLLGWELGGDPVRSLTAILIDVAGFIAANDAANAFVEALEAEARRKPEASGQAPRL
jgi:hypothetical protein